MGISILINKSMATIKYEGVSAFMKKSLNYTKRRLLKVQQPSTYHFKDILFINGCALPHPQRYRVDHQIEQLHYNGYSCDKVYFEEVTSEMAKYYRAFVFFRCPFTEEVGELIQRAKYFNKKVFFDVDDLVIDQKYVKDVKYLNTMSSSELDLYLEGVERHKKTLLMCDYALTTTSRLAKELSNYVEEVYINRNVASDQMIELSNRALANQTDRSSDKVILGYFSGSITHNEDFELILEVLEKIFIRYSNVFLKVVGILDIPEKLEVFKDRIIIEKFTDWTKLPEIISSVDINLAPLVNNVFNEAKSENKWTEAALVKIPTVASGVGAFKEVINHKVNGILCDNSQEWFENLEMLIKDEKYRIKLGEYAHKDVMHGWTTSSTGYRLLDFIESKLNDNVAFVLPSTKISGGVNVVIKHCNILRAEGIDVTVISMSEDDENIVNKDGEVNVISYYAHSFHGLFRKCVATLWTTTNFLNTYPKIRDKYYLVQSYETNFYEPGNHMRIWANLTYNYFSEIKYITISKWCESWLKDHFKKEVKYAPNGIDLSLFAFKERTHYGKIRILIEGSSSDRNKNVDESFMITNQLDRGKYEIWYLTYDDKPKSWYVIDKFLHKVPYDEVSDVYSQCDILLKSSRLESFSYPPLEMMATGGVSIVAPNEGNLEYLIHNVNCLLYEPGNIQNALEMIEIVCTNEELRKKIIANGLKTVKEREWSKIKYEVLELYDFHKKVTNGDYYEQKSS
ncbi:glycosyltransferase [Paenibacillus sp. JNUCC32]|uniref:glycosyltransferase n=1 Tax=Paenibacillus sp. JNUCC32 TaxID=2777984 RepID=UPI001787C2B8|nr:glycosyltransferase [Paenibacillus sp. JNUCC-32]QOT09872.1 glycosyltransferase [Paenibacillus sp. JNUCC-32]